MTRRQLRTTLYWLLGIELAFAAFHVVIKVSHADLPWGPLESLFDLDEEKSVPTWFSIVQLFAIAAVLFQASFDNRQSGRIPNSLLRTGAAAFLVLSLDEGLMLHEGFSRVAKRVEADWLLFEGHGAWILPYLVVTVVSGLLLYRPLLKVVKSYPSESFIAVAGAALVVLGAVGLELVSYYKLRETEGVGYHMEVVGEELLEMAGASLILYAVMRLAAKLSAAAPPPSRAEPQLVHSSSNVATVFERPSQSDGG